MNHMEDPHFLVPAREEVLARLHRMLQPALLAAPMPDDLEAILWLNRAHTFTAHCGRVARMQCTPSEGLAQRGLMVPYELPSGLWSVYFADRDFHPGYPVLLGALDVAQDTGSERDSSA